MKKFNVENAVRNAEQIAGHEPYNPMNREQIIDDYIEAETPEEAIKIGIEWLAERIRDNGFKVEYDSESIIVYDDNGTAIEENYNFIATEIEK